MVNEVTSQKAPRRERACREGLQQFPGKSFTLLNVPDTTVGGVRSISIHLGAFEISAAAARLARGLRLGHCSLLSDRDAKHT